MIDLSATEAQEATMTRYGIIEDYEYNLTHKRHRLTIWSGSFMSDRDGEAYSLPNGNGYMVSLEYGDKVRVECPAPRTSENYNEVDKAINDALNAHNATYRLERLRAAIEGESISYGEIAELESLAEYIDPADTLLLQWAGVPEFPEEPQYVPNGKPVIRKRIKL
jgi:hypothetical protein